MAPRQDMAYLNKRSVKLVASLKKMYTHPSTSDFVEAGLRLLNENAIAYGLDANLNPLKKEDDDD